ncbi:MAG: gluconate 2-dehydrogenase subunit 3 family protein, partial [Chitinophagaceae bacterium]
MKRRDSIKAIVLGSVSAGLLIDACKPKETKEEASSFSLDRAKEELERENKLLAETFFDAHEMATITILADIIIPADEVSGSASDAKVPAFI